MGCRQPLTFKAGDRFLRRVDRRRFLKGGVVYEGAFDDSYDTLSFTFRDANLLTDQGLKDYQIAKALGSGDLPGICELWHEDLTITLDPPLPPRPDEDRDDPAYGHLHCVTDRPRDRDQRIRMAKLATDRGVLRYVVRKAKRSDI